MSRGQPTRFRKIGTGLWSLRTFRACSPAARDLYFYLRSGPESSSLPGVVVAGRAHLAEALGHTLEAFDTIFAELSTCSPPLAVADWRARLVWLPDAFADDAPPNPSVIVSWHGHWLSVPECDLKDGVHRALRDLVTPLGDSFLEAFDRSLKNPNVTRPHPPSHGVPHGVADRVEDGAGQGVGLQKQEQQQEQKQNQEQQNTPPAGAGAGARVPDHGPADPSPPKAKSRVRSKVSQPEQVEAVLRHWADRLYPDRKPKFSPDRRERVQARLNDGFSAEELQRAIDGATFDDWIMGRADKARPGGYRDIETVLRDVAQVERLIERAEAHAPRRATKPAPTSPVPDKGPDLTPDELADRARAANDLMDRLAAGGPLDGVAPPASRRERPALAAAHQTPVAALPPASPEEQAALVDLAAKATRARARTAEALAGAGQAPAEEPAPVSETLARGAP